MKTKEEVKEIKNKFISQFSPAFRAVNNNLSVGLGKDPLGEYTLEVRLTNNKLKSSLPSTFDNLKVNIEVIGIIKPL